MESIAEFEETSPTAIRDELGSTSGHNNITDTPHFGQREPDQEELKKSPEI